MNKSTEPTMTQLTGVVHSLVDVERTERLVHLVKETCHFIGDMAELGVYRGGSAKAIAQACPFKTLHLFDTFQGLPEDDEHPKRFHKKGDFAANENEVKEYLKDCSRTQFHVGRFPDTVKELHAGSIFSFVHIDADIYQSTKDAIDYFKPRMVKNGIMVFDDYDWKCCPAIKELVDSRFPADKIETARQQCWIRI